MASREWLEQRREPMMWGVMVALYGLVAAIVVATALLLEAVRSDPETLKILVAAMPGGGGEGSQVVGDLAGLVVSTYSFLLFSQLVGIAAVQAGQSLLHDRQCGTWAFLLLAPIGRLELLLGKVIGAVVPPWVGFLVVNLPACAILAALPATREAAAVLPPSTGGLVAVGLGSLSWATFIGSVGAVVSSQVRDVRTAQQTVWFVVFFAVYVAGYLLGARMGDGALFQLGVAGLGALGTLGVLGLGTALLSRDVTR